MARTPSMTAADAETALGPRGALSVNAENKLMVRKWCTAMGLPGVYGGKLAYAQLAGIYNITDNSRLRYHQEQAAIQGVTGDDDSDDIAPVVAPVTNGHDTAAITTPDNSAQVQRIAALLGEMLARPGVDVAAVNALIDAKWQDLPELIARYSPVTRIEVKAASGDIRAVDGHTHKALKSVIELVSQNIAVMTVGPAGGGKSTCGEQVAHALGISFHIQGAAAGTHEYLGYKDGYGQYHSTPFRMAFEHGGLFLAEELDSGSADVPLVLNAGLANGHMSFPDRPESPVKRHPDFRIIANANTYGNGADRIYVGRTQLDGATIDRFAFVTWDYDTVLERKLCGNDAWCDRVQALRRAAESEKARIIISPRASIFGARMIAAGWSFEQCEEAFIWKGAADDLRRRIVAKA